MTLLFALLVACSTSETSAPVAQDADHQAQAPHAEAQPGGQPGAVARDDAKWKYFGAPFSVGEALPASAVLSNPEQHADKPVRFQGELTEVCQKMGCWAVVRDDAGHSVRITMKDHAFGIDKDTQGRACDIEGQLVKKAVDPEQLKHFEEEGATNHPEAGKTETWEMVASSVAVARS